MPPSAKSLENAASWRERLKRQDVVESPAREFHLVGALPRLDQAPRLVLVRRDAQAPPVRHLAPALRVRHLAVVQLEVRALEPLVGDFENRNSTPTNRCFSEIFESTL